MSPLQLTVEIIGHITSLVTFLSVAAYITIRRSYLRRTMRRAFFVYWLVILVSVFLAVTNTIRIVFLLSKPTNSMMFALTDLFAEYPSVVAQGVIILAIISLRVIADIKVGPKRVLAIGAHPDDLEIACGGTLAKMRDAGYLIRGIVMTRGEEGGSAEARPEEARRGARFLGLERVEVLNFHDTRLQEQSLDILAVIEEAVQTFKPDIIFTHSIHDQHQDHQVVYEATLRAGRNQSTILCHESPSATKEFIPSLFVDISDYLDVKIESIREYRDQREKPYVDAERVRGIALFRGGQAKVRAAEGFEAVRALSSSIGGV